MARATELDVLLKQQKEKKKQSQKNQPIKRKDEIIDAIIVSTEESKDQTKAITGLTTTLSNKLESIQDNYALVVKDTNTSIAKLASMTNEVILANDTQEITGVSDLVETSMTGRDIALRMLAVSQDQLTTLGQIKDYIEANYREIKQEEDTRKTFGKTDMPNKQKLELPDSIASLAMFAYDLIKKWLLGPLASITGKVVKFLYSGLKNIASKIWEGVKRPLAKLASFFAKPFQKIMSSKGGKLITKILKVFGRGLKFVPGLNILFGIYDFFMGFTEAEDIVGKAKEKLTFFDKVLSGISGFISGLTFGLIDTKSIFKFLFDENEGILAKVKNVLVGLYDKLPSSIKNVVESIVNLITTFFSQFTTNLSGAIEVGKDVVKVIQDVISKVFEVIVNVFKNMSDFTPVGVVKNIGEKAWGFLGDKISSINPFGKKEEEKTQAKPVSTIVSSNAISKPVDATVPDLSQKQEIKKMKAVSSGAAVMTNNVTNNNRIEERRPSLLDLDMQMQLTGM